MTKKPDVEVTEIPGHEIPAKKAEEVASGSERVPPKRTPKRTAEATPKDLTNAASGIWPGNTPHRVGSYYCNLHKLGLKTGEKGLLCALPEGFVFERVDVHSLEAAPDDVQIELELHGESPDSMGIFHLDKGTTTARQIAESNIYPGLHAGKKKVHIRSEFDMPDKGRILISFVGYQIEPWR